VLHVVDERGVRLLQSLLDVGVGSVLVSEEEVVTDRTNDQDWLLRHIAYRLP